MKKRLLKTYYYLLITTFVLLVIIGLPMVIYLIAFTYEPEPSKCSIISDLFLILLYWFIVSSLLTSYKACKKIINNDDIRLIDYIGAYSFIIVSIIVVKVITFIF